MKVTARHTQEVAFNRSLAEQGNLKVKQLKILVALQADDFPAEYHDNDRDGARIECASCQHFREVPWNTHIECVEPDEDMCGDQHGIKNGWFMYPLLFDPTWKTRLCGNFEPFDPAQAVSPAVSRVE